RGSVPGSRSCRLRSRAKISRLDVFLMTKTSRSPSTPQMAHGDLVVREPASPSGAGRRHARFRPLLDLVQESEALLAEEQVAVPDAHVDVDDLTMRAAVSIVP